MKIENQEEDDLLFESQMTIDDELSDEGERGLAR